MLVDSNIVIYSAQPENQFLRHFMAETAPAVSAVSYVEVLGYHRLSDSERDLFDAFFREARVLPLSQPVLETAVRLRQLKRLKLGDSLVAGTALLYDLTLVTRNVSDFSDIEGLRIHNPFAALPKG